MSYPQFSPGEVAIFVALDPAWAHLDGAEVVIDGPFTVRHCPCGCEQIIPGHFIRVPGRPLPMYTHIDGLRKKPRPPPEQVGDWDSCVWQPEGEAVT